MAHPFSPSHASATAAHLRADGLSLSFGARRVLTDLSLTVSGGDRVGLIGENGSGKSSLLRVLAGMLAPSAGTVAVRAPGGLSPTVGLLHQEPPFGPSSSIAEALDDAVASVREAAQRVKDLGETLALYPDSTAVAEDFAQALETAERLGAWDVDARIGATLDGLGLGEVDRHRPTGELSGGQRSRLSLAWLLLSAPDVLLLDEPTNHLDDDAAAYLTGVLQTWRSPVLFASHDRAFLDETATALLDLDPSPVPHAVSESLLDEAGGTGTGIGLTRFTGSYTDYLAFRADTRARWWRQYRDEQAELKRLRASVIEQQSVGHTDRGPRTEARAAKKFYADRNAKVVSRRVNDARARLQELEHEQIRKPPAELEFAGLTAASTPSCPLETGPVLTATHLSVRGRLAPVSFSISRGERWLITGANGTGKSTLMSVLAGILSPDTGELTRLRTDRVGLLTQDTVLPDPHGRGPLRTADEAYTDLVGAERAGTVPLSTFGLLAGRDHHRPVTALSVGQQRRLALAVLLADPPEILLLDEPTNHLSLSLSTAMEESLRSYPGTVVLSSHDRWLRARWSGRRLDLAPVSPG
ncbi:MAG: ABC-F family ATP-binding cassette domain-containing protein [Micrococcaceae bacterium]